MIFDTVLQTLVDKYHIPNGTSIGSRERPSGYASMPGSRVICFSVSIRWNNCYTKVSLAGALPTFSSEYMKSPGKSKCIVGMHGWIVHFVFAFAVGDFTRGIDVHVVEVGGGSVG